MKKWMFRLLLAAGLIVAVSQGVSAQCSICTKTAQQLGEKPARALNGAILYLAFAPMAIIGFLGYRWWKNNRDEYSA